jgi:hypothetical protein
MDEKRNSYRILSKNFKARYILGVVNIKLKLDVNPRKRYAMDSNNLR